jgi:hypothetical protein
MMPTEMSPEQRRFMLRVLPVSCFFGLFFAALVVRRSIPLWSLAILVAVLGLSFVYAQYHLRRWGSATRQKQWSTGLAPEDVLEGAARYLRLVGATTVERTSHHLIADMRPSGPSLGEQVHVDIEQNEEGTSEVTIKSTSSLPTVFDCGSNRRNIERLAHATKLTPTSAGKSARRFT